MYKIRLKQNAKASILWYPGSDNPPTIVPRRRYYIDRGNFMGWNYPVRRPGYIYDEVIVPPRWLPNGSWFLICKQVQKGDGEDSAQQGQPPNSGLGITVKPGGDVVITPIDTSQSQQLIIKTGGGGSDPFIDIYENDGPKPPEENPKPDQVTSVTDPILNSDVPVHAGAIKGANSVEDDVFSSTTDTSSETMTSQLTVHEYSAIVQPTGKRNGDGTPLVNMRCFDADGNAFQLSDYPMGSAITGMEINANVINGDTHIPDDAIMSLSAAKDNNVTWVVDPSLSKGNRDQAVLGYEAELQYVDLTDPNKYSSVLVQSPDGHIQVIDLYPNKEDDMNDSSTDDAITQIIDALQNTPIEEWDPIFGVTVEHPNDDSSSDDNSAGSDSSDYNYTVDDIDSLPCYQDSNVEGWYD